MSNAVLGSKVEEVGQAVFIQEILVSWGDNTADATSTN